MTFSPQPFTNSFVWSINFIRLSPDQLENQNRMGINMEDKRKNRREPEDAKGELRFEERKRWGFFGLPFTFTVYKIYDNDIQVVSGLLTSKENDCYMYRVSDVELTMTLFQRMFGLGTVHCFTSDVTDKNLVLTNIRNAREIKDFIYQAAEESKRRRRTVNLQDIGAVMEDEG